MSNVGVIEFMTSYREKYFREILIIFYKKQGDTNHDGSETELCQKLIKTYF